MALSAQTGYIAIYGEGELSRQLANPGSPGKMAVKMECVMCMCLI